MFLDRLVAAGGAQLYRDYTELLGISPPQTVAARIGFDLQRYPFGGWAMFVSDERGTILGAMAVFLELDSDRFAWFDASGVEVRANSITGIAMSLTFWITQRYRFANATLWVRHYHTGQIVRHPRAGAQR